MSLYYGHQQQYQQTGHNVAPSIQQQYSVADTNQATGLGTATTLVSVAPRQQGMVWNGSQWVNDVQQQSKAEMYTAYYHQWNASNNSFLEQSKQPSLTPQQRSEIENQMQWTKYYADLSSQAAHYFHQNPNALTAPFQLPPAPVKTDSSNSTAPGTASAASTTPSDNVVYKQLDTQKQAHESVPDAEKLASVSIGTGEGALKRYVDRCLVQCSTPVEKTQMIKLIEQMIQGHLQNNTYHITVWDNKELLRLPMNSEDNGKVNSLFPVGQQRFHSNAVVNKDDKSSMPNRDNGGYYGPTSNSFGRPDVFQQSLNVLTSQDNATFGYYGPSAIVRENSISSSTPSIHGTSSGPNGGLSSHHKFANKSKKHKENHNQSVTNKTIGKRKSNGDNYYGPSSLEIPFSNSNPSFQQQEQNNISRTHSSSSSGKDDDFISLPNGSSSGVGGVPLGGFNNNTSALSDRKRRFNGPGNEKAEKKKKGENNIGSEFDRFMGKSTIGGSSKNFITLDESDYEKMTIKGTCQILEKDYLRLTAPPKAELVRPQPILEQHLLNLKTERLRGQNSAAVTSNNETSSDKTLQSGSSRDYLWFCSQLKAIRQDCTVQRIQNAFAIDVYETHGHIALEEDDLNEYNQCQTQLKELYKLMESESRSKPATDLTGALSNRNEFVAYRIIYHVFLTGNKKYTGGSSELFHIMLELTAKQKQDHAIQHALKVREACCNNDMFDYHLFFMLYRTCPNSGKFLMNHMIPTVRHKALLRICKGYRPGNVETDFVLTELGLLDDKSDLNKDQLDYGCEWLLSCGCVLSDDRTQLITKDSIDIHESTMEEKKSLI